MGDTREIEEIEIPISNYVIEQLTIADEYDEFLHKCIIIKKEELQKAGIEVFLVANRFLVCEKYIYIVDYPGTWPEDYKNPDDIKPIG